MVTLLAIPHNPPYNLGVHHASVCSGQGTHNIHKNIRYIQENHVDYCGLCDCTP